MGTMKICVGNWGSYNAGYVIDRWVDLPMPPAELDALLSDMRKEAEALTGELCEEFYVSDFDGIPLGMRYGGVFSEYSDIGQLNVIAKMTEDDSWAADKVESVIDCGIDEPDMLLELANWLEDSDELPCYSYGLPETPFYEACDPEEKFGYMCLFEGGLMQKLEDIGLDRYIDVASYGEAQGHDCALGEHCYIELRQDMPGCDRDWEDLQEAHMLDWSRHETGEAA